MMVINLMITLFEGSLKLLHIIFQISLYGMIFSKYENHIKVLPIYTIDNIVNAMYSAKIDSTYRNIISKLNYFNSNI